MSEWDESNSGGASCSLPNYNFFSTSTPDTKALIRDLIKEALQEHGLIPKPKKLVTKTIERWVNVYPGGESSRSHFSEESANNSSQDNRTICVKLTGSYEIEE